MSKNDFQQFYDLIEKNDRFLLTSHRDPDGDSIGSLMGLNYFLKDIGKQTTIYNHGRLPHKYSFLDMDGIIKFSPEPIAFEPQVAIIIDCPNIDRIGFVRDYITDNVIIANFDHHPDNESFGDMNYNDESACAVAEIIYDMMKTGGYEITPRIAESFYAAIASDTGRFKFANTSARCFQIVSELVTIGANPKQVSDKIFSSYTSETMTLLGSILKNLQLYDEGRICVLRLRIEDLKKFNVDFEDTEGIIDYSLVISGVKVGILFKEINRQMVKVGLRSQNSIDISYYAHLKGGGGHLNAAGFIIEDQFENAVSTTIGEVAEFLNG